MPLVSADGSRGLSGTNESQAQTHISTHFSRPRRRPSLPSYLLCVQSDHASSVFQRGQKEILEALGSSGSLGK